MNNKIFAITITALVITAGVSMSFYLSERKAAKDEAQVSAFPMQIGEWSGKDLPLRESDYEILETRNLIMREYSNPAGESVYFYIIYSGNNRKALHPPEICFSGGGSTILKKTVIDVTGSMKANMFLIEDRSLSHAVLYWFKVGNLSTYDYIKQQMRFAIAKMLHKKDGAAMIRVSTIVKDGNPDAAVEVMRRFATEIEPLIEQYVP